MPGTPITDQQVRLYMTYRKDFTQAAAAAKAGFSERTGRKVERDPTLPSQRKRPRTWRTRADPLDGLWDEAIVPMLQANPGLKAVTIFEELQDERGDERVPDSVRRSLERRVRRWRALHGADQEVYFPQDHPPGRQGLSDFTDVGDLGVTIAGETLAHRLYHFRMACSGWEHAEIVLGGESFAALSTGLQNALWRLGGVPDQHRTDSLSAAFRNLTADEKADLTARYEALCQHYGMTPTRNNRGEAHENGTIEASHGHLKRRLDQALRRRGSRDFASLDDYRAFLAKQIERHNIRRRTQVEAEAARLKPLPKRRTTDFTRVTAVVTRNATISVDKVLYSVPSRLIGQRLSIHLFDDRLDGYLGADLVVERPRVRAVGPHRVHAIDYRDVIASLRRKPGALRHLTYRDALFPRVEYRRAWEALDAALPERQACRVMVGLLDLAAAGACEAALARRLAETLDAGLLPDLEALTAAFQPATDGTQTVTVDAPDLAGFDALVPLTATAALVESRHDQP